MVHGAVEFKGMTGIPNGTHCSRSVPTAGSSSVSNLLKAFTGAPVRTKGGSSDER